MSNRPLSGDKPSKAVQLFRTNPHIERGQPRLVSAETLRREANRCLKGEELVRFWREWYADDFSLGDLYIFRLPVAWRIMRRVCELRGLIQEPKQLLADTGNVDPSPWEHGFNFFSKLSGDRIVDVICTDHTLPLLPPDIPEQLLLGDGETDPDYDPGADTDLRAWCQLFQYVGKTLGIDRTEKGRYGLAGLVDPHFARAAMPSPRELVQYERLLVRETFDKLREDSTGSVERWLMDHHELNDSEVAAVLAMARFHAKSIMGLDDLEAVRSMLVARMERELDRLAEAGDSGRGRALVMKEIWKIASHRGQDAEQDDLDEMDDVVAMHHREVRAKNRQDLLTGGSDEVD